MLSSFSHQNNFDRFKLAHKELCECFSWVDENDINKILDHLVSSTRHPTIKTIVEARVKYEREPRPWNRYARRYLHDKKTQEKKFKAWFTKWSGVNEKMRKNRKRLLLRDHTPWGQKGAAEQYKLQLVHIRNGCLEDPPDIEMHINMGKGPETGLTTWKEKRSTSQAEARNRVLNLLSVEVGQMTPVYMSR